MYYKYKEKSFATSCQSHTFRNKKIYQKHFVTYLITTILLKVFSFAVRQVHNLGSG